MEFCTQCGSEVSSDHRFCAECGETVVRPSDPPSDSVAATTGTVSDSPTKSERSSSVSYWLTWLIVLLIALSASVLFYLSDPMRRDGFLDWAQLEASPIHVAVVAGFGFVFLAFAWLVLDSDVSEASLAKIVLGPLLMVIGLSLFVVSFTTLRSTYNPYRGLSPVEVAVLDEMYEVVPDWDYYDSDLTISWAWAACSLAEAVEYKSEVLVAKVARASIEDPPSRNVMRIAIGAVTAVGIGNESKMGLCGGDTRTQHTVQEAAGFFLLLTDEEIIERYG